MTTSPHFIKTIKDVRSATQEKRHKKYSVKNRMVSDVLFLALPDMV
jgi:hypothetical protein